MHERGLAESLWRQAVRVCRERHGARVLGVRVEIGPLAGVEPLLLASAFREVAEAADPAGIAPELVVDAAPLVVVCLACAAEFTLNDFDFYCRACGGRQVRITRGDALHLLSVTIDDPAPCDAHA